MNLKDLRVGMKVVLIFPFKDVRCLLKYISKPWLKQGEIGVVEEISRNIPFVKFTSAPDNEIDLVSPEFLITPKELKKKIFLKKEKIYV